MGARRDLTRDRIGRIDGKRLGMPHIGRPGITMREHEPRHAIGQRRLADTYRASDQPGMRNTSAAIGVQQCRLGLAMTEQRGGFTRRNGRDLRFDLTRRSC